IDAPTGSGKSSVAAALLAARKGRKILIAVRTVSQLTTFIRELKMIREKHRALKFVYLVGKRNMCPLGGEGDVYRWCEGVKAFSLSLMKERAERGALVPSKDPFVLQQIKKMDWEKPLICPYFIASRVFVPAEGLGIRMIPSTALKTRAERLISESISPRELPAFCDDLCPYETAMQAARSADVIILNYHHLFNDDIREQLYANLQIEPRDVLLLIDEAHNCGEVMQDIQSITLEEAKLDQALRELGNLRKQHRGADAVRHVLPRIRDFMHGLRNSHEAEDWFDPAIFERRVLQESLYGKLPDIVDDLMAIAEFIREKNTKAGEYRETAIERLSEFFFRLSLATTDPAYLTVYRKEGEGIALDVRNIDPAAKLEALARDHACCVMISGTLSPVESYRKYYFGKSPVETLSLPNAFPRERRILLGAQDVTTAFSMRQNRENQEKIEEYIVRFAGLPGNLAIYFPSYQILETFSERAKRRLRSRALFIEPKEAHEAGEALKTFLSLPSKGDSGVLLAVTGGKWSEGLDYRGEMLGGAMVIGLPLAPYTPVRKMVIQYFRRKFGPEGEFISYTLPAINRAMQALGRVLRTPEDRGILVLAEKRFLDREVRSALPGWMQEELVSCDLEAFSAAVSRWKLKK
ncbi:MAG: ATP-dependent DNA helicase, partial [Methanoregulaceae archaeon]